MPSNAQHKEDIAALAAQLQLPVDTKGMNNEQLAALAADLRAKARDAELTTQADKTPEQAEAEKAEAEKAEAEKAEAEKAEAEKAEAEKAEAEKAEAEKAEAATDARPLGRKKPKKMPPYYVAPGKALTTKRGILSGDDEDEVKATDFSGGQEALDGFVKTGHVLKG